MVPILTVESTPGSLADLYRDLHANPELSYEETRTARVVAESLTNLGYEVHTGLGRTGVVGVLRRGSGPTVLLRADMDGLPVTEETGLPYASTAHGVDPDGNDVGVMHACGHDVHVSCLLGAARVLAADDSWSGTLIALFQPAEELGTGARAMVTDGLYDLVGTPDVVLGQHVGPFPAGILALHPGAAFATSDSLKVTLYGKGGHGSRPEACIDPIVMAAAIVMRLQTIVSREIAGGEIAVITVGTLHAGTKVNIIPDTAELGLNIRTYDPDVRERVLAAVERVVRTEAAASGAIKEPKIEHPDHFPLLYNDPDGCARTLPALASVVGSSQRVIDPGPVTGSEDVGELAKAAGAPCVYWILGGADPAAFDGAATREAILQTLSRVPSNHSPGYAPVIEPTLSIGVGALVVAAKEWLG